MTDLERETLERQLNAFCQALRYITGTYVSDDGRTYNYHKPFENARYCLDFARMLPE